MMSERIDRREGVYRAQPYTVRVDVLPAKNWSNISHDTRRVRISSDTLARNRVDVHYTSKEPVEAYERSFFGWTFYEHEPRSLDDHVEDALELWEEQVDERLDAVMEAKR